MIYRSLEKLPMRYSAWFILFFPLHIWKHFGGELWESSSQEHWQIFLNSMSGSWMPGQNAWLSIILTGAFISSIPLAVWRTQFSANMFKHKKSLAFLSQGCYLGGSELRGVAESCCPAWKDTGREVPASYFREWQQRAAVLDNFPRSFFSEWGILKFSL